MKAFSVLIMMLALAASALAVDVDCTTLDSDKTITLCMATAGGATTYSKHVARATDTSVSTITAEEYNRLMTEDIRAMRAETAKLKTASAKRECEARAGKWDNDICEEHQAAPSCRDLNITCPLPPVREEPKADDSGSVLLSTTPVMPQGPAPKFTKASCKATGGKWSKDTCKVKATSERQ